jgi:hypothetical protein
MLWHIVLANNSTTLTNNSRVSFVRRYVLVMVVIYNIYIIYIIVKSLSHFYEVETHHLSPIYKLKFYEVICIINFTNTLFTGLTRGGPWVPSHTKQNSNRTQKYKVIAFKKNKKDF